MDEGRDFGRWRVVLFLGIFLAGAVIYDGTVFYSRWSERQQGQRAQTDAATNHEQRVVDTLGGDGLKIVAFYAVPGVISRGARIELCYGVTGAKKVRIEPPVGEVWPALSRCMQVSPQRDTEYRIVAEDGSGHSATQVLPVKVR